MSDKEPSVVVRLMIFSGREDPEWSLSKDEILHLKESIRKSLGQPFSGVRATRGLGYRGFLVKNINAVEEIPTELLVYRGCIQENPGKQERLFSDVSDLEKSLIQTAQSRGHSALLKAAGLIEQ